MRAPPIRGYRQGGEHERRAGAVFVSHAGTVHPRGFLPLSAGSVRTGQLAGVYRMSPLPAGMRDHGKLAGRCGARELAPVCGGSPPRAFALAGGPYARGPRCSYQPGTFPCPDDPLPGRPGRGGPVASRVITTTRG
ncbi:MAG TPA: hypothetical protein VKV80_10375 [Streptosporangiaceae bacterium]|nr:hypothetical protein [Streptosporangiaceae bacterium]